MGDMGRISGYIRPRPEYFHFNPCESEIEAERNDGYKRVRGVKFTGVYLPHPQGVSSYEPPVDGG